MSVRRSAPPGIDGGLRAPGSGRPSRRGRRAPPTPLPQLLHHEPWVTAALASRGCHGPVAAGSVSVLGLGRPRLPPTFPTGVFRVSLSGSSGPEAGLQQKTPGPGASRPRSGSRLSPPRPRPVPRVGLSAEGDCRCPAACPSHQHPFLMKGPQVSPAQRRGVSSLGGTMSPGPGRHRRMLLPETEAPEAPAVPASVGQRWPPLPPPPRHPRRLPIRPEQHCWAAGGQIPRLAGLSGDHRSSPPPGPECWVQMGHLGQRRDCDGSSTRPWATDSPVPHPRPHRLRPGLKAFGRRSPQSREQRAGDAYPWASASGSIPHSAQTDTSGLGSFTEPGGDRDGPQTAAAERRHSGPRFTRPPGLVRC